MVADGLLVHAPRSVERPPTGQGCRVRSGSRGWSWRLALQTGLIARIPFAARPRVAARSSMSGVSWPATLADAKRSSSSIGQCGSADTTRFSRSSGRKCVEVSAVRSDSLGWNANCRRASHTGVRIATCRCATPVRCVAFADERRGDAATQGDGCVIDEPARPWSRRSPAAFQAWNVGGHAPAGHFGVLIAAFCAAPARCGAFADERAHRGGRRRRGPY